jgi:hypothetical protein
MEAPPVVITPASPEKGKRMNPISWFPGRSISGSATTTLGRGAQQPPTPSKPIPYDPALIRIHHGAVDVGTVASGSPPELFQHVTQVLITMGVEIQQETEFKYRCIRPKKRRDGQNFGLGLREPGASSVSAFNMSGSAAMNGVCRLFLFPCVMPNLLRNRLTNAAFPPVGLPAFFAAFSAEILLGLGVLLCLLTTRIRFRPGSSLQNHLLL